LQEIGDKQRGVSLAWKYLAIFFMGGEGMKKILMATLFFVLVSAGLSVGGGPVSTVVPSIYSEDLDEVDYILEENELSGKKLKPYCEGGSNEWVIKITGGNISGTFYPWHGGSYPVTGTKTGKTLNMKATGCCDIYCNETYEITVTKVKKGRYEGTFETVTCPDYACSYTGPDYLVKGHCGR
jgi:hypothetical protein